MPVDGISALEPQTRVAQQIVVATEEAPRAPIGVSRACRKGSSDRSDGLTAQARSNREARWCVRNLPDDRGVGVLPSFAPKRLTDGAVSRIIRHALQERSTIPPEGLDGGSRAVDDLLARDAAAPDQLTAVHAREARQLSWHCWYLDRCRATDGAATSTCRRDRSRTHCGPGLGHTADLGGAEGGS